MSDYSSIQQNNPSVHELMPAAVRAASLLLLHPQSRNLEREKGTRLKVSLCNMIISRIFGSENTYLG